jgi:transcriptional regulator with XRE-family HTH domain
MANVKERTVYEEFVSTDEGRRLFEQERLILDVTQTIFSIMEKKSVRKAELSRRLGKSKAYITRLLDGRTNMTLRTLSDLMLVLDQRTSVSAISLEDSAANWEHPQPLSFGLSGGVGGNVSDDTPSPSFKLAS